MKLEIDVAGALRLARMVRGISTNLQNHVVLLSQLSNFTYIPRHGKLKIGRHTGTSVIQRAIFDANWGAFSEFGELDSKTVLFFVLWQSIHRKMWASSASTPLIFSEGRVLLNKDLFDLSKLESVVQDNGVDFTLSVPVYSRFLNSLHGEQAEELLSLINIDTPGTHMFSTTVERAPERLLTRDSALTETNQMQLFELMCYAILRNLEGEQVDGVMICSGQVFVQLETIWNRHFRSVKFELFDTAVQDMSDRKRRFNDREYLGINNDAWLRPFLVASGKSLLFFELALNSSTWSQKCLELLGDSLFVRDFCQNSPAPNELTKQENLFFSALIDSPDKSKHLDKMSKRRVASVLCRAGTPDATFMKGIADFLWEDRLGQADKDSSKAAPEFRDPKPDSKPEIRDPNPDLAEDESYEAALDVQQQVIEQFPQWAVGHLPDEQKQEERSGRFAVVCKQFSFAGNWLDQEAESALAEFLNLFGPLSPTETQLLATARADRARAYEDWRLKREFLAMRVSSLTKRLGAANNPRLRRKLSIDLRSAKGLLSDFDETVRWAERPMFST